MCVVVLAAGAILKAIDHLSDWWGIAIVVTIGTLVWLGNMREDSDDLSAWAIVPGLVVGVFFGAAAADAWWGAVVGGIVLGFLCSFPGLAES